MTKLTALIFGVSSSLPIFEPKKNKKYKLEIRKPKICCIGSNLESYDCLNFLLQNNCVIDTLITLPSGENKNVSDYYDLHDLCSRNNIHVVDTTNVNDTETISELRKLKLDYLFTLGWSQIFKEDFINCFSKFVVGTHPSKLPYGRGRAPLPWTIIEDLRVSALSFFKIDTGVDTGSIIFQREFEIPSRTYVKDLYSTVSRELGEGFYAIYKKIFNNEEITFKAQMDEGATVRGKRTPTDGLIEFHRSTEEIDRLVRAVSEPYPGAYCYYKDKKIVFWEVNPDYDRIFSGTRGQILKKVANGILVQFSDGNLWLNNPTDELNNPVEMKFFKIGDKLGYSIQDEIHKLKNLLK
ncbi:methionyl-tRNA formyltransferase [Flagellimonas flava]|uniref:Methionyl-tRNA formyltransferase n=1 Tax=Flagellimonas flava TaxID=570519 RepID=A0A1M5J625_9FLAO|nr:formyltransferase family protein [Allomuricauda flava]SHG36037.1 methionyl-tRNA formyltransferase [Allomuricauda flava]